ncbi:MAG: Sapep family Mn(2+)-dependent dipeptidase [Lachnospiraceae bacterium]|nr:Sapep family Mn(2+)-dependent dipeptidase [Lachnospiraceae bacterium]
MTNISSIKSWMASHEDEMLSDIKRLIAIDSAKGEALDGCPFGKGPAEALKEAGTIAARHGFAACNMDSYVLCIDMPGKSHDRGLDILAHLDVVPATGDGWNITKPFEAAIKDGKLYGRGAADDKGPAMAALYAMRAVKETGAELKTGVRLILGSDEESGSQDIEYYYSKEKPAPFTISPDADFPVVNVERGRCAPHVTADYDQKGEKIVYIECGTAENVIPGEAKAMFASLDAAEKGLMTKRAQDLGCRAEFNDESGGVLMTLKGKTGHASLPEDAVNALTALLEALDAIKEDTVLFGCLHAIKERFPFGDHYGKAAGIQMSDEICGPLTASPTILKAAEGHLEYVFDARLPEEANEENVIGALRPHFEKNKMHISCSHMSRPHIVRPDSPFVGLLLSCYEQVKNVKGYPIAIGGGTYVHEVENGVAFGPVDPGTETNMHGVDENIPVKQLTEAACIYALAILGVCGVESKI